jgi:predicted DNA-binding protein with PD1-like motif/glutaredoxin
METLPLQLDPGQDLHSALSELAAQQQLSGFVLGVVGNLSQATFSCPGQQQPTQMRGELEVITLNGTFSPNGVHLHLSLSDGACQVWGGHLEPGTIVLKGAQLLLGLSGLPTDQNSQVSKRVELAVLPGCPWSLRARQLLERLSIPHEVETIESDERFESFRQRSGMNTFPQVFIDGEVLGGYDDLAQVSLQPWFRALSNSEAAYQRTH